MKKLHALSVILGTVAIVAAAPAAVGQEVAVAQASGSQEVPAISTGGAGLFIGSINEDSSEITYQAQFQRTRGTVLQSHLHIGQPGVNGGIMLFICSNSGNGPAGTPACPAEGTVNGTWTAASVIPVANQGLGGGPFALKRAINLMRDGVAYYNVHTSQFPAGEIRGAVTVLSGKSELDAYLTELDAQK